MEEIDRSTKVKLCYNCGDPVTNSNHAEHIPPRCLYEGRDDTYKVNRYKIPACHKCNNGYSRIDEEFRNMIGVVAEQKENEALIAKTVKSMMRDINKAKRVQQDESTGKYAVKFESKDLIEFHIKNFKGVYFIKYGQPISKHYRYAVDIYGMEKGKQIGQYLLDNFQPDFSGHPDIFSFIMQPFRKDAKLTGKDIPLNKNEEFIACWLRYNKVHAVVITALYNA